MADEIPMNEEITQTTKAARPEEGIARGLARARAARISDLRYRLQLELEPGAPRLKAEVEIALQLRATTEPLVIDFRDLDENGKVIDGRLGQVRVNGNTVTDHQQINGHIVIPAAHFKNGENNLKIAFETGVAAAGRPVIRYLDRDDGSEYIYTLFVPMDASLAFPCFDQPDLKGRFTLDISAPNGWTVIGNSPISQTSAATRANYRRTRFEETQPISTYLVSFAAGPFAELKGTSTPGSTPLHLFVRKSKLERAKEEWPEVERLTREGLRYLSDFFAHQFPFLKYDQVLIPGFAYGGMEHVGATFLREDAILFRATPTTSDKLGRASLILHELTHQWFGDLVTMRWFDDLWLKEGFATYMAYRAMAEIYPPREIWKRFSQTLKPAAYGIDSTKGTTPIYQEVPNLKDAKSAYGAIVYQKAPAVLHALSFTIGNEAFRQGVQLFLKEHAYANAEWSDLIGAFERSAKQRLAPWAEAWVRRRGMPQIDLDWSCDGAGKIARIEVKQRDVLNEEGLWPIRSQLMLAYEDGTAERIAFSLNGERESIKEAVGKRCPVYIFSNDGDYGYGRFPLDARSRAAVIARIDRVTDPFERSMLWGALWDAVREAELAPIEYIKLATRLLTAESDEELAQNLIGRVTTAFQRYLSERQQAEIAAELEKHCFERMMKAETLGMRIIYFRAFRALATSTDGRAKLKEMLAGKLAPPGLEIKPLDRWQILRTLLAVKDNEAEALLAAERERDATDDGRKQAYVIEAARADAATKRRYFDDYLSNRNVPEDWVEGSLGGFNAWNQAGLSAPYLRPALEALPQMKRERKIFFVLAWLNAFIGGQRSVAALTTVRDFLRDGRLDRDLQLKVLEVTDELERTAKIRTKFAVE